MKYFVLRFPPYVLTQMLRIAANSGVFRNLQTGDNHETVANAKVTAKVQLPDGKQKTISLTYDPKDQHYTGILKEKASGQYQVKITADIKGEKTTGRFNFNR